MESKKGTPCCDEPYDLIYGFHCKWMYDFKQWKCCKCGKEYCEKEMFKVAKESISYKEHPWSMFLEARMRAMAWMKSEMHYSDAQIAFHLSMDEEQVYLIRKNELNRHIFDGLQDKVGLNEKKQ